MNLFSSFGCLFLLLSTQVVSAQPAKICSLEIQRKAMPLYEYGRQYYHQSQNVEALAQLDKALEICPSYAEAYMLKGVIYEDLHKIDSAIYCYTKAISFRADIFPNVYLTLGKLEYGLGLYEQASLHLSHFLQYPDRKEALRTQALDYVQRNQKALLLSQNRVPFSPINLGDSINTSFDEYLPIESLDGEWFILTRRYNRPDPEPHLEEDFFISHKDSNQKWGWAQRMPEPVNSNGNEGAQSISADGHYLYFAGCGREDSRGSCDLYVCVKNGNQWGKPINLGYPVNTEFWESQPSISSDGRTLYFCSNRLGGYGGGDLWKTVRSKNGIWSNPENLGPLINTSSNENSPFIHPDQKTLYFSSNGHPGLGGLDLFYARLNKALQWDTAVNLGYPINTWADEATLSVNREGNTAYFSSSKYGGMGGLDIYQFELYQAARPKLVSFFKGRVSDLSDQHPLEALFELTHLENGQTVVESYSDAQTGEFLVCLPAGTYALNVSKEGYLFYSEHFDLSDSNAFTPLYKEIKLSKVEAGKTMVLRNIFFTVDSYSLDSSSFIELYRLLEFLQENPQVKIEISGHTDASGREEYNQILSQKRAQTVADYLFERGITKERILSRGYGSTHAVATNETAEGKQQNRRTEIKIL